MKTGELKAYLKNIPDDLDIVVSGSDHSYIKIDDVCEDKAEQHKNGNLSEYYDQANLSHPKNKVIKVFRII